MNNKFISDQRWAFTKFILEENSAIEQKKALQNLAFYLRKGEKLKPKHNYLAEQLVITLLKRSDDHKVIRWSLNILALIASNASAQIIQNTLHRFDTEPSIVGAAVTALSKVFNGEMDKDMQNCYDVDPVIFKLAALQNTNPKKLEWGQLTIDIEQADPEILKLALILVGTKKALPNLFHPKYSNEDLVSQLSEHDDSIVRQYSVWGIIENDALSPNNLKIDLDEFDKQPFNVQSKLVQLASEKLDDVTQKHDIIERGSSSPESIVREGVAKGIQSVFYDGIETIVMPWMEEEKDTNIKRSLVEHIASHSKFSGDYYEKSMELYETTPSLRSNLLIGAIKNPSLSRRLQKIENHPNNANTGLFGDLDTDVLAKLARNDAKYRVKAYFTQNTRNAILRLDKETRVLNELSNNKDLYISTQIAATIDDIDKFNDTVNYNILHISGHANKDGLESEDSYHMPRTISAERLKGVLTKSGGVECLILNACDSNHLIDEAKSHANYIIACNGKVPDADAILFSKTFYSYLKDRVGIQNSFNSTIAFLQNNQASFTNAYTLYIGKRNSH